MKKLHSIHIHSILRYVESSQEFIEIKQVLIASKFARGSMMVNAWNTFILKVEHLYTVGESVKSLDMDEPTLHAEKTACY